MDRRNFLFGFGLIFLTVFILVGLAIYVRVEQRALAAIPVQQTATAERQAFIENLKFGLSATPTVTPTGTPRPKVSTFTASPTFVFTDGITATLSITLTPVLITPTPSRTRPATQTPLRTPGPSPTDTPKPTFTPTGTITPETISLTGRVLFNGTPVSGVSLALEDQGTQVLATTATAGDGSYIFANLAPTATRFNVVFSQESNPNFAETEVMSFTWIGPIQLPAQGALQLPDLEIAPLGFGQVSPAAEAEFSAAEISAASPLTFTWTPYPGAARYWVDLLDEDEVNVWQTDFVGETNVDFDGALDDGTRVTPGNYLWGIGAQFNVGTFTQTVYGLLVTLIILP